MPQEGLTFFVDVDNTLLNNDLVKERIKEALILALGEKEAIHFWKYHDEFRAYQKLVDFPVITRIYCKEKDRNTCELTISKIFTGIDFSKALYPKAFEVLDYLKTLGKIFIFSEGDEVYQKLKIEKSGIAGKVDKVYLYKNKLEALPGMVKEYSSSRLIFIDDRDDKLINIKKLFPKIVTVVVCQGHYASPKCKIDHSADLVVGSVGELLNFKQNKFN